MKKILFNYSKLRGRITEVCGSQKAFAKALNISDSTLTSKMKNYTYFTQKEILQAIEILRIPNEEVSIYFFTV